MKLKKHHFNTGQYFRVINLYFVRLSMTSFLCNLNAGSCEHGNEPKGSIKDEELYK